MQYSQEPSRNESGDIEKEQWFLALALAGEAGELANLAKKEWRDGVSRTAEIRLEAADVFIYLERLAKVYGFDLGDAVAEKRRLNLQRWGNRAY